MAPLLQAQRLCKSFGEVEALKNASFDVQANSVTGFLGENGAGKTTVLKLLLGFLRPDCGCFSVGAERIGYVPERPAFFPWLRGGEILEHTARLFGISRSEAEERTDLLCRRLAFDRRLLGRKAQTYSLGNQKKLSYLQSLLIRPDLLMIDEPFSALDPASIRSVRLIFRGLKDQGRTLLLSSHLVSELEKVCDAFIIIRAGRIVAQGPIPAQPDLESLFFYYTGAGEYRSASRL